MTTPAQIQKLHKSYETLTGHVLGWGVGGVLPHP